MVNRRIRITGRVHGVGFRAFVEAEAHARRLEGWVRNRRDGSVEAVVAGSADSLDAMVAACRRGPPAARVIAVDVVECGQDLLALRIAGERFSVLATA